MAKSVSFESILRKARDIASRREFNNTFVETPKAAFKREPSDTEKNAEWSPLHVARSCTFCIHGRSYFGPCVPCRRNQAEAQLRFNLFCKENGILT